MSKSKQQLLDERYLRMARIWAENSYCERRQVGALIVRGDAIISDGYNGTPSGFENICEDEEHVIDLPKQIFEVDGKFDNERIVAGNVVPLMTSEGQRINGTVQEIKADVVVMDMNHPLAGCDLNFVGEVIESRPATNEELAEIARMMSGGGCSCGCDSCGDGCGDGCGDHDHEGCGCGCNH